MNKDEIAGLVERLQSGLAITTQPLMLARPWNEAADVLTTLSARVEALEAELGNEKAHYETAQANWDLCLDRIEALEAALRNPPRHKWWSAGEPDCPPELKAPNGELWRMQCKVCGNGTGDGIICQGGLQQILKGSGNG